MNKENKNPVVKISKKIDQNDFKDLSNNENLKEARHFRRTISYINTKRIRAAQYCTLNKRRLSLNHRKIAVII
jgi:hypothetical protein